MTNTTNTSDAQPKRFNKVSTTERQWKVLSMLQRGRWIGTSYIRQQLALAGFEVTLRTVQRDLVALSQQFLIEHNNSNPQGWRWRDDAPLQSMPNMNLSQAVAFRMMEDNLTQLLPQTILRELRPWFDLAKRQLSEGDRMDAWLKKVRIESPTLSLIPPDIDISIQNRIYQAVFEQKQIHVAYQKPSTKNPTTYQLNPLGIVQRGTVIYLLATKILDSQTKQPPTTQPFDNIRLFTLHRFIEVCLTDNDALIDKGFNIDDYIESGAMGFHEQRFDELPKKGKKTKVVLTFDKGVGISLTESKLSKKQKIHYNDDNTVTITAEVNLTRQLVWWLRGFGKQLKSAEPSLLWQVVNDEL